MTNENLDKQISVKMTLGHLLVVWNVIANKVSESLLNKEFTEEEKRAIWILEDLCENELIKNKIEALPQEEWDGLIAKGLEHVKSLPVDLLD